MQTYCIVIPCYNEGLRLDEIAFNEYLAQHTTCQILFVNDNSTDDTFEVLKRIREQNPCGISILTLNKNVGKAEAVRCGINKVQKSDYDYIGYLDADLSAPLKTISDMLKVLQENDQFSVAFGSRIKKGGAKIKRSIARHYLGRIFTTYMNLLLNIGLYDTQCGAKLFKTRIIDSAFKKSFVTQWFFDIEIVLRVGKYQVVEVPITEWTDFGGSKLRISDYLTAPLKIVAIYFEYRNTNKAKLIPSSPTNR